jgi:hypothetical protein
MPKKLQSKMIRYGKIDNLLRITKCIHSTQQVSTLVGCIKCENNIGKGLSLHHAL